MIPLPRLKVKTVRSHHDLDFKARLLQDGLGGCPWRVAVASILCNKTRRTCVDSVLEELLNRWPTPVALAAADRAELAQLLRPLGLQHQRAKTLVRFSFEFCADHWEDFRDLPGVGPYVADAVGLVCFGCTELESGDHALEAHARRLRRAVPDHVVLGGEAG